MSRLAGCAAAVVVAVVAVGAVGYVLKSQDNRIAVMQTQLAASQGRQQLQAQADSAQFTTAGREIAHLAAAETQGALSASACPVSVRFAVRRCVVTPANGYGVVAVASGKGTLGGNPVCAVDYKGAPMFCVNIRGAQSYGEPFCVTGLHLESLACLGGPFGSYGGEPVLTLYAGGQPVTLTAGDIAWIHAHGG